jgi:spore coat protein A
MALAVLKRYRWVTPITGATIPTVKLRDGEVTHMCIGETSKVHVFANAAGPGFPRISQKVWGYGTDRNHIQYPGPTLVAQSRVANKVRWSNLLSQGIDHPCVQPPADARLGGMHGRYSTGYACVHLHGGHLCWTSDGHPVRREGNQALLRPETQTLTHSVVFDYANTQRGGALLWYHDHVMDATSMNVYAGLAGGYVLRDAAEAGIADLPSGAYEMPLIIQDRSFTAAPDAKGRRLLYGHTPYLRERNANALAGDRQAVRSQDPPMGEFKGDAMCVNGKVWPHLEVEPRAYRFRVLNGCNTRMLVLRLSPERTTGEPDLAVTDPQLVMLQIGGDAGFMDPVELKGKLVNGQPTTDDFLVLASGERADIVVDFSGLAAGQRVYLSNHATENSPLGNGGDLALQTNPINEEQLQYSVLQFRVKSGGPQPLNRQALQYAIAAIAEMPSAPNPLPAVKRRYLISERSLSLTASDADWTAVNPLPPPGHFGWNAITMQPSLDGSLEPGLLWAGPAPDLVGAPPGGGPYIDAENQPNSTVRHTLGGAVELWEFDNRSVDVHPMHLHLASFQVLSRHEVLAAPLGQVGAVFAPDPNERGWKDTVRVNAPDPNDTRIVGIATRVLVKFDDDGDTSRDYSGHFVFHCHLLEHEDMGMMRPLEVYPPL